MNPTDIHLVIDELIVDADLAADPVRLQGQLTRELTRRLGQQSPPLPSGTAAIISAQVIRSVANPPGHPGRGGRERP